MQLHHCGKCGFRARYDRKPGSLLGRIWRWHIGFCPGWKSYMASLPDEERAQLEERYKIKKETGTPPRE